MGKPVYEKLGILEEYNCAVYNPPGNYDDLIGNPPFEIHLDVENTDLNFIHLFCSFTSDLEQQFPHLKPKMSKSGMLWVSWPKGKSKLPKDLNENIIRDTGLAIGLVDVKVCAIDDDWSALKFVYRLKDR